MKKLLFFILVLINTSSFSNSYSFLDLSLSDFCNLQPGVQERDFVFYFPNEEVGITATSICVYKDQYGQYYSQGNLKNGKRDGKWIWYLENGQKTSEVIYRDGHLDGEYLSWHNNGQMLNEGSMTENGNEGFWTSWYDNGLKKGESYWRNGKMHGLRTEWSLNGKKFVSNWVDNKCISGDCD